MKRIKVKYIKVLMCSLFIVLVNWLVSIEGMVYFGVSREVEIIFELLIIIVIVMVFLRVLFRVKIVVLIMLELVEGKIIE